MSGIYLHIPFCKQACSYCDFYFVTRQHEREPFVDKLVEEIEHYSGSKYAEEPVQTLYIGGGTPSLLSIEELDRIFTALKNTFNLQLKEVTCELNPDDVSSDYLSGLRQIGVERASMGVQTFNSDLLNLMNRAHTSEESLRCLKLLSTCGFQTYSVDLIYGNPGQSLRDLDEDIETLLAFDPPHISAYSLTVEPTTRLGKQVELGRILPPENGVVARHFDHINERFEEENIYRYEVSNYSKPGKEGVHNSNYWKHENYLGMGPGAHSFWWKEGERAKRWRNVPDLKQYLSPGPEREDEREELSLDQLVEERIMMGLRTSDGIKPEELESRYHYSFNERQLKYLKDKEQEGKVRLNDSISLTRKGIKIADTIILDLITVY